MYVVRSLFLNNYQYIPIFTPFYYHMNKAKLLFVCSKNKWRSRTAETMYKNHRDLDVKSAGTEHDARIKITAGLIHWADVIFVMENKHREILKQKFSEELKHKKIIVLDILDNYQYMDEELIEEIKSAVETYL